MLELDHTTTGNRVRIHIEKDLKPILARVSEPELSFATDEDTIGPDPLARRYDFSENPLDFANEQIVLVERFRKKLLTDYVKDGEKLDEGSQGLRVNAQPADEER